MTEWPEAPNAAPTTAAAHQRALRSAALSLSPPRDATEYRSLSLARTLAAAPLALA